MVKGRRNTALEAMAKRMHAKLRDYQSLNEDLMLVKIIIGDLNIQHHAHQRRLLVLEEWSAHGTLITYM